MLKKNLFNTTAPILIQRFFASRSIDSYKGVNDEQVYCFYCWQFYSFTAVLVFQIDFIHRLRDQKLFFDKLHIFSPGNYPSESAIIF